MSPTLKKKKNLVVLISIFLITSKTEFLFIALTLKSLSEM